MLDSRTARFRSIDHMAYKFPWQTGYAYAGNSPIAYIDYDGMFRMSKADCEKYPEIASWIYNKENGIFQVTKGTRIMKILAEYGRTTVAKVIEEFSPSETSPIIHTSSRFSGKTDQSPEGPVFGQFIPSSKDIEISEVYFEHYKYAADDEDRMAALYCIVYGICHELSHFNDNSDKDRPDINHSKIDNGINDAINAAINRAGSQEGRFQAACNDLRGGGREHPKVPQLVLPGKSSNNPPTRGGTIANGNGGANGNASGKGTGTQNYSVRGGGDGCILSNVEIQAWERSDRRATQCALYGVQQ